MRGSKIGIRSDATSRDTEPQRDLFGFVTPARVTSSKPRPAAEWPAAGDRPTRTVPVFPAGDRSPVSAPPRPPASIAGDYARRDTAQLSTLTRADGVALIVRDSYRPRKGHTDAERFVELGYPGGGRPRHISNLYDRRKPGPGVQDDLDGHAIQHGDEGPWYLIRYVAPGAYRVERTGSRRGRKGS